MENLNIYKKALKETWFKIKKGTLTGCVAGLIAISSLTGCKGNKSDISDKDVTVSNVLEAVSEDNDEKIDDMLLNLETSGHKIVQIM